MAVCLSLERRVHARSHDSVVSDESIEFIISGVIVIFFFFSFISKAVTRGERSHILVAGQTHRMRRKTC